MLPFRLNSKATVTIVTIILVLWYIWGHFKVLLLKVQHRISKQGHPIGLVLPSSPEKPFWHEKVVGTIIVHSSASIDLNGSWQCL